MSGRFRMPLIVASLLLACGVATVTARAGKQAWVVQLTAGDGYLASNQRQLLIGLGEAQSVEKLEIKWVNGEIQSHTAIPVNRQLLAIQGALDLHLLPQPKSQAER